MRAKFRFHTEDEIINAAGRIVCSRIKAFGDCISNPEIAYNYLQMMLGSLEHEVFGMLCLNTGNELIEDEPLFRGSVNETKIYQREVVKRALFHNAAAVIFYHNHPSGSCSPSSVDISITKRLKDLLELVDVRVKDHIIIAGHNTYSFSSGGLL